MTDLGDSSIAPAGREGPTATPLGAGGLETDPSERDPDGARERPAAGKGRIDTLAVAEPGTRVQLTGPGAGGTLPR